MIIRLDYFFLWNLLADFLIVLTANYISRRRISALDIGIGCLLSNLCFACIFVIWLTELPTLLHILPAGITLMLLKRIWQLTWQEGLHLCCLVLFLTFAAVGACSRILRPQEDSDKTRIGMILILFAMYLLTRFIRLPPGTCTPDMRQNCIYEISLKRKKRNAWGEGFYDTGNQLKSRINGKGMLILSSEIALELMDEEERDEYGKLALETLKKNRAHLSHKKAGFYVICYRTIGERENYMPGIMIEEVQIQTAQETIVIKSVLAGISREPIFKKKRCDCLLPADIFDRKNRQISKERS